MPGPFYRPLYARERGHEEDGSGFSEESAALRNYYFKLSSSGAYSDATFTPAAQGTQEGGGESGLEADELISVGSSATHSVASSGSSLSSSSTSSPTTASLDDDAAAATPPPRVEPRHSGGRSGGSGSSSGGRGGGGSGGGGRSSIAGGGSGDDSGGSSGNGGEDFRRGYEHPKHGGGGGGGGGGGIDGGRKGSGGGGDANSQNIQKGAVAKGEQHGGDKHEGRHGGGGWGDDGGGRGGGGGTEDDDMRQGGAPRLKRSWALRTYARLCYLSPLGFMVALLSFFLALCLTDRPLALAFLTVYVIHHAWCHLYHVAVFSGIGQARIWRSNAYNYRVDRDAPPMVDFLADQGGGRLAWVDVMHFVLLPNYKEDADILREAIDSFARSSVAKHQMGLVLAMEAREANVKAKAAELAAEYKDKFLFVLTTFHPGGLPNETPGKSSNTRWAAQKLWEFVEERNLDQDAIVLTVSDADSDFHPCYFEALTSKFCGVGKRQRERTLWQPPILHYKNYHTQPAIVGLTSMFVAQHELANLADPSSTALPYSSYSLSSNLARHVGGWDPDWISEDWHMFLKCFLNTGGEVSVEGIFLPVVNYTPEDVSYSGSLIARWEQAKRHALGISEMVYFLSSLPDAYWAIPTSRQFWYFFYRGTLVMYKILATHIEQGTYWILGTLNGPLVWWVFTHPEEASCVGAEWRSYWLRLNLYFSMVSTFVFAMFNVLNVTLYRGSRHRMVPFQESGGGVSTCVWKWVFGNPVAYYVFLMAATVFMAPLLGLAGGLTSWRAAIKTAKSHKFEYVVALKPQAAKNRPGVK